MDIHAQILAGSTPGGTVDVIKTVDMHTAGEPTRIVVSGYPMLEGRTLLEKRAYAREKHDDVRRRLMWEPRGHRDMYGAILVAETEFTASGEADMGVLFCHNEGYSTMCGHATVALGRFLVDTQDVGVFPRRHAVGHDEEKGETTVRLHAPCGIVEVAVPTVVGGDGVVRSDGEKRVRFVSVESFVSEREVEVEIGEGARWDALRRAGRTSVRVDVAFGGAFYAIVDARELGFCGGLAGGGCSMKELDAATAAVKAAVGGRAGLVEHPSSVELEFLYGVIVVDPIADGRGLGLCFFADQEVDRSPCGSGVSARVALEVAAGRLELGAAVEFESLVGVRAAAAAGAGVETAAGRAARTFRAAAVAATATATATATAPATEVVGRSGRRWAAVRVAVGGQAFYTGAHAFLAEPGPDALARSGFLLHDVC